MNDGFDLLRGLNPHAVDLAKVASLAARIEPELLRVLRMSLCPLADASAEADLWWSSLVEVRSPTTIRLSEAALTELRAELAQESALAADARAIVERMHAEAADLLKLEESLVYQAVGPKDLGAVDRLLAAVLGTLIEEPARRAELAAWAVATLARLPVSVRELSTFWSILFVANAQGRGHVAVDDAEATPATLAQARQIVPSVLANAGFIEIEATRERDRLLLRRVRLVATDETAAPGVMIVPRVEPLLVEVEGETTAMASVAPQGWTPVPVRGPNLRLRTMDGSTYALESVRALRWNGKTVLIVGAAGSPTQIHELTRDIGGRLAAAGYGLVTENRNGPDADAASAFVAALSMPAPVSEHAMLLKPPGAASPTESPIDVADALIMVGGGHHAADVFRAAMTRGVLSLPLPRTHGAAEEAFRQLREAPVPTASALSPEELESLDSEAGPQLADRVMQLLEERLRATPGMDATTGAANENGFWILVDGTGGKVGLPRHLEQLGKAVGRVLAERGYSLVTLGTSGVSYVVARAFLDALRSRGPTSGIHRIVNVGSDPDFRGGRRLEVQDPVRAAVVRADAVLFIGASQHSEAIDRAASTTRPVLGLDDAPFGSRESLPLQPATCKTPNKSC